MKMIASEFLNSLTEAELSFIAALDYGSGAERHLKALSEVIARGGAVRMETEFWYPYEVIELGMNHLQKDHEREYAACMAIVFLNLASGEDLMNDVSYILESQFENIASLPMDLQEMLLSLSHEIKG
jgi:hypothetical protein